MPRLADLRNQSRRRLEVGLAVDALGVEHADVVHRVGVALLGRRQIEPARLVEVLGDAVAFLVQRAEPEQRGREPAAGGTFIPDGRLLEILRHAAAFGETGRHLVGGGRLARCGGGEQRSCCRSPAAADRPLRPARPAAPRARQRPVPAPRVQGATGGARRRQRRGHGAWRGAGCEAIDPVTSRVASEFAAGARRCGGRRRRRTRRRRQERRQRGRIGTEHAGGRRDRQRRARRDHRRHDRIGGRGRGRGRAAAARPAAAPGSSGSPPRRSPARRPGAPPARAHRSGRDRPPGSSWPHTAARPPAAPRR